MSKRKKKRELKFPECAECINRLKPRKCRQCDSGEFFEEHAPDGVDDLFRN